MQGLDITLEELLIGNNSFLLKFECKYKDFGGVRIKLN